MVGLFVSLPVNVCVTHEPSGSHGMEAWFIQQSCNLRAASFCRESWFYNACLGQVENAPGPVESGHQQHVAAWQGVPDVPCVGSWGGE
eukprot:848332-Alexandrium_andersonii.AAC.1